MRAQHAIAAALLLFAAPSLSAQRTAWKEEDDATWLDHCRHNWGDSDRGHACAVRDVPIALAGKSLEVDGRQNGSIRVIAWDGNSVKVTARLQASADDDAAADRLLNAVKIVADGRSVRADGPSSQWRDDANWSASYTIHVPRHFDLDLSAHNGSIAVAGVNGHLELRTTNGSVVLDQTGGEVHARTQNGSLRVELAGSRWDGGGLDAETQNGSVRVAVPKSYVATLETGTVNGRINTEIPVTFTGRFDRHLTIPINGGGTRLRAMTTNGSVAITTQ